MAQENPSFQNMVEHEFINSNNAAQSILRLAVDPPTAVVRRLVAKFIGLIVSIMDRILELLGVAMTDPDKLYENVDKAKHNVQILSMIMVYILEDPVIRENLKQVAIALNDSALKPFLAVALITLKEMRPAIDEAQDQLIEQMVEGLRRAGDGATDAIENVISGIPGVGNTWSAISGVASLVQTGQSVAETTLKLILETTYRILELLRKTNVPGLESIDSFIDFGLNAYNVYTNVTNKFDAINATVQQLNFNPAETFTKEKLVSELKKQDEDAKAMMPQSLQDGVPSAAGASVAGTSAPVASDPVASAPVAGAPVAGADVVSTPVAGVGDPVVGAPVVGAPVTGAPVAGTSSTNVPSNGVPASTKSTGSKIKKKTSRKRGGSRKKNRRKRHSKKRTKKRSLK